MGMNNCPNETDNTIKAPTGVSEASAWLERALSSTEREPIGSAGIVSTTWLTVDMNAMREENRQDLEDARRISANSNPAEWRSLDDLRKHLGR
jgi:hypothetical protein